MKKVRLAAVGLRRRTDLDSTDRMCGIFQADKGIFMENSDDGIKALMDLLKDRPELLNGLLFNAKNVQDLLDSDEAKELALGVNVKEFLRSVTLPENNGSFSGCIVQTHIICKGTIYPLCFGGTGKNQ